LIGSRMLNDERRTTSHIHALLVIVMLGAAAAVPVCIAACGSDEKDGNAANLDAGARVDGSNPSGVGNFCTKNEDCATKNCYLGPGGGYCTTDCADEGSTAQCPLDTICKPIQGGARRCLLICGSLSTCRELDAGVDAGADGGCAKDFCPRGSSCVSVSNSDSKACEPDPG
jgi:hypothetical protein